VASRPDGQRRLYSLKPEPFRELDKWLAQYGDLWEARLDRLEEALEKKRKRSKTPCFDLLVMGMVLAQVPSNASIRNKGWVTYWKPRVSI
jgi:hypothetical protein